MLPHSVITEKSSQKLQTMNKPSDSDFRKWLMISSISHSLTVAQEVKSSLTDTSSATKSIVNFLTSVSLIVVDCFRIFGLVSLI